MIIAEIFNTGKDIAAFEGLSGGPAAGSRVLAPIVDNALIN